MAPPIVANGSAGGEGERAPEPPWPTSGGGSGNR
eukprot:COSAG01_NODE_40187_length_466_cov_5.542234_1_plen_33_part_10